MKSKHFMWMIIGAFVCGIVLAATSATAARTETTTIYADRDTFVSKQYPSTNYGTQTFFKAGNETSSYSDTTYFHFPYSAPPSYLQSAEIEIYYYDVGSSFYVKTQYVTDDSWGENTLTWNNQPYTFGGWFELDSEYVFDPSSVDSITINVQSYLTDTNGLSICLNCSGCGSTTYMSGYTRESVSYKPTLTYTYLVSSFGIPGYDVIFLALSSLGMVAFLGYKYRTRRTE